MLRQLDGARGSRTQGIVYLVLFNILWLLLVYTYALIVLTPPGYAKDVRALAFTTRVCACALCANPACTARYVVRAKGAESRATLPTGSIE